MKPARLHAAPIRSPAREALAAAIAARDEAQKRVGDAREAAERSLELVTAAEAKLMVANNAAKAGRDRLAEQIAASAKSGTGLPPGTLARELRIAECDAQDSLDACRKALEISRAALSAVGATLADAERRVEIAVAEVLKDEVLESALPRVIKLQAELIPLRLALRWLWSNHLYKDKAEQDRAQRALTVELPNAIGAVDFTQWEIQQPWIALDARREALKTDADAPLAI